MKSSLKYLVLLFCFKFIEGSFRCDYTYNDVAKGWFKLHVVPANWFDARLRCSLEGATLVSPTTLEIKSEMKRMMKVLKITHRFKQSPLLPEIFTGIHATYSVGDYQTIEGTPLAKILVDWEYGQPDNKDNNESCITMNSSGYLADRTCVDTTLSYICYRPKEPEVEINECGTVDPEYHLDERTKKCYKFHKVERVFSRASMACTAEGGHLAIVNSDIEATVLSDIFSKIDRNEIMVTKPEDWKEVAFIGFYDWGERRDFRTVHGQTLSEAGYSKFFSREPNETNVSESCGSITSTGLLYGMTCEYELPFICEKNPDFNSACQQEN